MAKGTHFHRGLPDFKEKKGVITKDCGGGQQTIFRLLGILPKITE